MLPVIQSRRPFVRAAAASAVLSVLASACNPAPEAGPPAPAASETADPEAPGAAAPPTSEAAETASPDVAADIAFVDVPGWPLAIPAIEGYTFFESVPGFLGPGPLGIRFADMPGSAPGPGTAELAVFTERFAADLSVEADSNVRVTMAPAPGIRATVRASAVIDGYALGGLHVILDDVVVGILLDNLQGAPRADVDAMLDVLEHVRVRELVLSDVADGTLALRLTPPAGWNAFSFEQGAQWVAPDEVTTMGLGVLPGVWLTPEELEAEPRRMIEQSIPLEAPEFEEPRCGTSGDMPWCSQVVTGASEGQRVAFLVSVGLREEEAWTFGGMAPEAAWTEARPVFEAALASIRRR